MDKNNDGIIDSLLIEPILKRKRGRKPLGLPSKERKEHDQALRRIRDAQHKRERRLADAEKLIALVRRYDQLSVREVSQLIVDNPKWKIKYNPNATALSGVKGGRIRRQLNKVDDREGRRE